MSSPYPENPVLADAIMARVRELLTGREHDGMSVRGFFHYGAVDIDPSHLVVWLLMEGRPDDQIPEWLLVAPDLEPSSLPVPGDHAWLLELRDEVVEEFRRGGWPRPEGPRVLVDSSHRVKAGGGYRYFNS